MGFHVLRSLTPLVPGSGEGCFFAGRKGELTSVIGYLPCEDELPVSLGWNGPAVFNLTPSPGSSS